MKRQSFLLRLVIFILVVSISFGGIWFWWSDGIAPVNPQDQEVTLFVVKNGEGVKSIAQRLASENLIRSATAFYVLVKLLGIERDIQAGDFRLRRSMSAEKVAKELTVGIVDVWVTTLEGWRIEEIATKLAKELSIPETEFLKVATEGYMFPDTYLIPQEATAGAIAKLFRDTFEKKFTPEMQQEAELKGLTTKQVVILASIVEREGKGADKPLIAGVLLHRLSKDYPLQADATVQYALGYQSGEKDWWKKSLTYDDLKIKSPYNTYEVKGLPPAPIGNPGLASLKAVLEAPETDYFYYIHDKTGMVHFSKTLEEHTTNVEKYLR